MNKERFIVTISIGGKPVADVIVSAFGAETAKMKAHSQVSFDVSQLPLISIPGDFFARNKQLTNPASASDNVSNA